MNNRYIISTIKSWNIDRAKKFKEDNIDKDVTLISSKEKLNFDYIEKIRPKYIFFPHWSWIIPEMIHEKFNCIVFHMTDLPFGRGGTPLQNLIERKIYNTKITAIKVSNEIDEGPVYMKRDFDISYGNASDILGRMADIIFLDMIPHIINDNIIPKKQKGKVVKFKRKTKKDCCINKLDNIDSVYDYIRVLDGEGYPFAFIDNDVMKYEFYNAKKNGENIIANVKISKK